MSRTPCPVCDFPLATEADFDAYARSAFGDDDDLRVLGVVCCWSEFGSDHRGPAIDWRARAPKAEARPDATQALRVAMEALEALLPRPTRTKPNVVESHLRMGRMWLHVAGAYVAIEGSQCFDADYGTPDYGTANSSGVLRWTGEDFKRIEERFAAPIRAAIDLIRTHIEPTPLEAALAEVSR